MVPVGPTDPIKLKEEELKLCRDAVKFFQDKPWKDKYLGVSLRDWLIFLQSHFPDLKGERLDLSDFDFLEKIAQRIEDHLNLLATLSPGATIPGTIPSLPPNLKQLVEEYEAAEGKKVQEAKAADIAKLLRNNWELNRNRSLLKQDLQPHLTDAQTEANYTLENVVSLISRELPELKKITPDFLSTTLEKTLPPGDDQLILGEEKPSLEQTKKIFQEVLQKALVETGLEEDETEPIALQAGEKLAEEEIQIKKLRTAFQQQSQYQDFVNLQEKQIDFLEKRATDPTYQDPLFAKEGRIFQEKTFVTLTDFVKKTLKTNLSKADWQTIQISDDEIDPLAGDIAIDAWQRTAASQDLQLWTLPEEKASAAIQEKVLKFFDQNLRRSLRLRDIILNHPKLRKINEILLRIEQEITKAQPTLTSSLKAATVQNIAAADASIEAGHPLGRIPSTITLLILKITKPEMLLDPKLTTADFVKYFQEEILIKRYGAGKDLKESQKASIGAVFNLMRSLQRFSPQLAKMLRLYGTHYIRLMAGRGALSFFLKYPDYILHLPYIFGKMFLTSYLKQDVWELRWKPRIIKNLIQIPGFGGLFRFWYGDDTNEFGLFISLPTRLKKKFFEATLRKAVKATGTAFSWLGQKLGIKGLQRLSKKLLTGILVGTGIGTIVSLVVTFWPQIKGALKRMGQALLLWFIGLYSWAAQYGPGVLVGAGLGSAAGAAGSVAAAVKVGIAVTAATGGNVLFGALAGFGTWIVANLVFIPLGGVLGGSLGYLFTKAWLGIKSALSSILGTGVEMTTTGAGVGLTFDLAGAAKTVLIGTGSLITGLYFYTQLVNTSSLLPPEGLEFLAGSKYIELEKGVQVGEESDKNQFEDRYHLPNDICDSPAKTVYYQISLKVSKTLTDIKITDKTTRTGEYGSVTVQEKSWEIDDLEKGKAWESEVYSFQLTPDFKDSYLSNTVTVTSAEGEEKTATLTLKIGNPPTPPLAEAANLLAEKLIACYDKNIDAHDLADNGECLKKAGLSQPVIDEIIRSVGGGRFYLQCVGFVSASSQIAGQPITIFGHAKEFYGKDNRNYRWHAHQEMNQIKEGDIFVSAAAPYGHIGVVNLVNANGFRLAEALGDQQGLVRYQNDATFITFTQAQNHGEWGFLRYGE